MNATQLERLREHLTRLRLLKSRERLEALLQEAAAQELSYADFLDQVLGEEVTAKAAKNMTMRTRWARFPFVKSLEVFDFTYQPSLDKKQIQQVATCHFIEHGENVVILSSVVNSGRHELQPHATSCCRAHCWAKAAGERFPSREWRR